MAPRRRRGSSPASPSPRPTPTPAPPIPAMVAGAAAVAASVGAVRLPPAAFAMATALLPALVTGCIGASMLLIAFNNVTDYGTNFAMVQHVLAMDEMIPALGDITVRWRAITSTALHHLAYAAIITTEAVIGALCTSGAWGQAQHATGAATDTAAAVGAVQMSLAGLGLGFLLFFFGFVCVGAEWFYMWGTENFNGQIKAFHWATLLLLAMLLQAVLAPPPGWEGGGPPAQIAPAED